MKEVLIIGSGIAGMSAAASCAERGMHVCLLSPFPSERSQSVMAAGGINAVLEDNNQGDSVESHIEDTLAGGCNIAGKQAVTGLCGSAEEIIRMLENAGMVFSRDKDGRIARRAFGGQSHDRTCYSGASTGKHIVSALVMKCRRYESEGLIDRRLWSDFHSGLIRDGVCYGALIYNEATRTLEPYYADAVIVATGGQNALFGKTTGSTQCDGYTAGKLFMQGAVLKNLEFIQYHPTTIETASKRMLISEAARGEGGRLYYEENGKRVYFMEEKYGPEGNLMTRDVAAREIYSAGRPVFLDVSHLESGIIDSRLSEVRDVCSKYAGIDITREPIPVAPSVHFFMGGLAVHNNHETSIRDLYAVGECASIYHGANRLGGNSLLAAIYSGTVAAKAISERDEKHDTQDFSGYIEEENKKLISMMDSRSKFPVAYIEQMLAECMNSNLGIIRDEKSLSKGITETDYLISIADRINYDSSVLPYFNYSIHGMLALGRACLACAKSRQESRGSQFRSDYPDMTDQFAYATLIYYDNGEYNVTLDRERQYES